MAIIMPPNNAGEPNSNGTNLATYQLAELLLSGLGPQSLHARLWQEFASASRSDVFMAVAIAIPLIETDLVLAEGDLAALRVRTSDE